METIKFVRENFSGFLHGLSMLSMVAATVVTLIAWFGWMINSWSAEYIGQSMGWFICSLVVWLFCEAHQTTTSKPRQTHDARIKE